jgi:hypothetical protein
MGVCVRIYTQTAVETTTSNFIMDLCLVLTFVHVLCSFDVCLLYTYHSLYMGGWV